ncbi:cytochrome-c peroxidase [Candidatus Woesearchaeota archaeon]|jgi:cytochrome c peroxidase|nr:cytochrome-c peroxidase [Candidatus Woesearchaeota archaeon]MDP6740847.1 cytochrome c peroxidase [Planctomycetota bacterium]MDP6938700.1 cytochrome c peroxidase [Planctomycetota bacterium]
MAELLHIAQQASERVGVDRRVVARRSSFLGVAVMGLCLSGTGQYVSHYGAQDLVVDTLPEILPEEPPLGLDVDAALLVVRPDPDGAWLALGRQLFFDPVLSSDRSVACASCHQPGHGFADPRPLSLGVQGRVTLRHAPALLNRALGKTFMWDGRAASLEEQVLQPIVNPLEMDLSLEDALARLASDEGYTALFKSLTGGPPTEVDLSRALATFVRHLWHAGSAVDRFRSGDVSVLSREEKSGMWIYESRGGCWRCHGGANFTDEAFHNTGIGVRNGVPLPGRMGVTGSEQDRGAFKTPTLRGLTLTGPYMHDGSMTSLEEVISFYRRGGEPNPDLDDNLRPLELTDQDVTNLAAFLRALSRVDGE